MARSHYVAIVAATLISALTVVPALHADEPKAEHHDKSMSGMDMMKGQMMDHCAQMMRDESAAPNEQWRRQAPAAPEKKR